MGFGEISKYSYLYLVRETQEKKKKNNSRGPCHLGYEKKNLLTQ
jgi:hypothetical protein